MKDMELRRALEKLGYIASVCDSLLDGGEAQEFVEKQFKVYERLAEIERTQLNLNWLLIDLLERHGLCVVRDDDVWVIKEIENKEIK